MKRLLISFAVVAVFALVSAAGSAALTTCRSGFTVTHHLSHNRGLRFWLVTNLYEHGLGCDVAFRRVDELLTFDEDPPGYNCVLGAILNGTYKSYRVVCRLRDDSEKYFEAHYRAR